MIENCESNEIEWIDDSFYMKKKLVWDYGKVY